MPLSILIVTNIPTPYKVFFLNELSKKLLAKGIILKIIFANLTYRRRSWKMDTKDFLFDHLILNSKPIQLGKIESVLFLYKNYFSILKRYNPDLVVTNGFSAATTKTYLYSLLTKKPFVIWSESVRHSNKQFQFLRSWQRKLILRRAAGCIVSGKMSRQYFLSLGAKAEKIFIAILTTDTEYFAEATKEKRSTKKTKEIKHLLSIGNLTKGKRFDRLIEIVSLLKEQRDDFELTIVGDGPEKEALTCLIERFKLTSKIKLVGNIERDSLPEYLARADCFLFPSEYDVWGMVLIEAMAAGLPCISSIQAGSTCDLIVDGETGFAMDFTKKEEVASRINWLLNNPEQSERLGRNAFKFIKENASINKSVNDFISALDILSIKK